MPCRHPTPGAFVARVVGVVEGGVVVPRVAVGVGSDALLELLDVQRDLLHDLPPFGSHDGAHFGAKPAGAGTASHRQDRPIPSTGRSVGAPGRRRKSVVTWLQRPP